MAWDKARYGGDGQEIGRGKSRSVGRAGWNVRGETTVLQEAYLRGTVVDFTQPSDIPFTEDVKWREKFEQPQELWEADNMMMKAMMDVTKIPTFGSVPKYVQLGEVCVHALAK